MVTYSTAKKYIRQLNEYRQQNLFGDIKKNDISLQIEKVNSNQIWEH